MMEGIKWLKLCRDLLERIHDLEQDCAMLEGMRVDGVEERMVIDRQLQECREALIRLRKQYPLRMEKAMGVIGGLKGMEHKSLWAYYVLGLSNSEAAKELHYDLRTFLRRKAEGLQRLAETKEE